MLPPGTQAAILSAHISTATSAATHVAVQSSLNVYRNAAVLELADRLLGMMSDAVIAALGIKTAARRVLISAEQQRHAIERRAISSRIDAELVASRLTEAVAHLRYQYLPQRVPQIFELVGYVPSTQKHILIPIKLVAASESSPGPDEWWVQTAHPFGARKLRGMTKNGRLLQLDGEEKVSNNSFESDALKTTRASS